MPRRSLQKSRIEDFEPKRKNAISLGSDSNIDKDSKPLRIGGKNTGIEISEDVIKLTKTLESDLKLLGNLNHGGDFFLSCTGDMNFSAMGQDVNFLWALGVFMNFNIETGITLYDASDVDDYFRIAPAHNATGDTTISTSSDNAPPGANLRLEPDGSLLIKVANDDGNDKVKIDSNHSTTEDTTNEGLYIDLDHTGICADGEEISNTGLNLDVNSDSPTMVGTVINYGLDIDVVGGTSGTQTNYGIALDVDGADTNIGMLINTAGTHIKLEANADVNDYATFTLADTGDLTIATTGDGTRDSDLTLEADGDVILDSATGIHRFYLSGDTDDLCTLTVAANGATTIATEDSDGVVGHLTLDPNGDLLLQPTTHTYSALPIGFTQNEPAFHATDTYITFFSSGNKQKVTLTDNCTDIHFRFPTVSGNFICVILQDGTGGRTISNWKTVDFAGNAGAGNSGLVLWAGGTAPSNTETADKADIASFYWDADNEIAYGTYTYNF